MTQETFETAIKLHHRLQELFAVREELEGNTAHKFSLSYIFESCYGRDGRQIASEFKMRFISDILDRHDKMIREEIDKEIEDVNKQIAEL